MRTLFLGKDHGTSLLALRQLACGAARPALVVVPAGSRELPAAAEALGIPCVSAREAGRRAGPGGHLGPLDLGLCVFYPRRIRPGLARLPARGIVNFHPAPLPEFRGVGGYNFAIWEGREEFGVAAHMVAPELDTGDLVGERHDSAVRSARPTIVSA